MQRFSSLLDETQTDCFAWALIPNHFHLLLRPHTISLSTFMQRLLTGYAVNFNHAHNRAGHLFQNRYKSFVCEEETYLLELVRYIHLNPLRAKIVAALDDLDTHRWSGHAVLLGERKLEGQRTDEVLRRFGKRLGSARKYYRQFIEDGIGMGKRPELVGGGWRRSQKAAGEPRGAESHDDRILGSGEFVERLQENSALKERLGRKISVSKLLEGIAEIFQIEQERVYWRSRQNQASAARAVCCYAAVRELDISGTQMGKLLHMSRSAVSQAVQRGANILQEQPEIHAELERLLLDN